MEMVEAGKVKVPLDKVYPLEEAKEALTRSAEGLASGKILVQMPRVYSDVLC